VEFWHSVETNAHAVLPGNFGMQRSGTHSTVVAGVDRNGSDVNAVVCSVIKKAREKEKKGSREIG
jgi:aspartokinase